MSFSLLMKVEGSGGPDPVDQRIPSEDAHVRGEGPAASEVHNGPKWSVHMILLQQCSCFKSFVWPNFLLLNGLCAFLIGKSVLCQSKACKAAPKRARRLHDEAVASEPEAEAHVEDKAWN